MLAANGIDFGGALASRFALLLVISALWAQGAEERFQPTWESLKQYQCPEWFRDAKFGIWAHWGPQCEPEQGDWYARQMYIQGERRYQYHLAHYGHPSKFGFKDICNQWKAEEFDPAQLIALYKRAGARYFVAMANHHCNFDCYDSKFQPWNSVNIGPKKDLVGLWAKAARQHGLRFGVSVHAARSWSWYDVAQGSDTNGPLCGVPYDGKLTRVDGAGQWWDGYDPQDLYAQNHAPGARPDAAYVDKFYNRVADLMDHYRPDLVYFDDVVLPMSNLNNVGLRIAAHYYNGSMRWHEGRNEAVMTTKRLNEAQRRCLVYDIEKGLAEDILPEPWQTCNCIGAWHYYRSLYTEHKYKSAATVIPMLADIVSKNGNLLLSIPVRGDGTIDSDERAFLEELASWMAINSEGIFDTRPWKVYGEGPSTQEEPAPGPLGGISATPRKPFTAEDFRFTTKANVIYAIALGWPASGEFKIKMLGESKAGQHAIQQVELFGAGGALKWSRAKEALTVKVPCDRPCEHAWVLKVTLAERVLTNHANRLSHLETGAKLPAFAEDDLLARSLVSAGNSARLHRAFAKARRGEPVTVAVMGGSITQGSRASNPEHRYGNLVADWWRKTFPEAKIAFVNAGIGATGSNFGALRAKRDLLSRNPDFVVLEFAVNDAGEENGRVESLEGLVRQILSQPNQPAVMLLFTMRKNGSNVQEWHSQVGRHYELPMVSFRDALWPEIQAGRIQWSEIEADDVHPNDHGHDYLARFIARFLERALREGIKAQQIGSMPKPLFSDLFEHVALLEGDGLKPLSNRGWTFDAKARGFTADQPGSVIEFELEGQAILVTDWHIRGPFGKARMQVDDLPPVIRDAWYDQTWGGYRETSVLARDLKPGKHRVGIELLEDRNPQSTGHQFRLLALGAAGVKAVGK